MKFIKHSEPAGGNSGGFAGVPQSQDWLKKWIEEKGRWVDLQCGCKEELTDRGLLLIGTFDDCEVLCERCNRFSRVIGTHKPKRTSYPDTPLF